MTPTSLGYYNEQKEQHTQKVHYTLPGPWKVLSKYWFTFLSIQLVHFYGGVRADI